MVEIGLTSIVMAVLGLWLGSTEYRLRKMQEDLEKTASVEEMEKLIDLKQQVIVVLQKDMRDDIHRLYRKMDEILAELHKKG